MEIVTLLVLGADSPERERLMQVLLREFGSLGIFEVANTGEAIVLLNEILVDGVVVVQAADDFKWTFIRHWMKSKPGWCDIPFCVAADADDCRELRRDMAARWLAVSEIDN